jgi:hypothetical protein
MAFFQFLNKNNLPKKKKKKHDRLAETYDPKGHFPYTLLLDEEGKVVRSWEGLPKVTPEEFTTQLKTAMNARP